MDASRLSRRCVSATTLYLRHKERTVQTREQKWSVFLQAGHQWLGDETTGKDGKDFLNTGMPHAHFSECPFPKSSPLYLLD